VEVDEKIIEKLPQRYFHHVPINGEIFFAKNI
jgi:hypothetical protein